MRYIFILILAVSTSLSLLAQNTKKGFKSLEKGEFDKAEEVFLKAHQEDAQNPSVNFGLAVIYANQNYNGYNIIKAWDYVSKAEPNLKSISAEDLEIIGEYFTNTEERRSSRPVPKKIMLVRDDILDQLVRYIREANDLKTIYTILNDYPDFPYYANTVHIRNYLEFREAEKTNTLQAYLDFVKNFPDAAQVDKAKDRIAGLAFKEAKQKNTLQAYEEYIKNYPNALEIPQALKARNAVAFAMAKQQNTIDGYERFTILYPDALEIMEANQLQMQLIYERAKQINTIESYNDFIRKYPSGAQYIDIFNLKANSLGKKYMIFNKYPAPFVSWIKAFDNGSQNNTIGDIYMGLDATLVIAGNTPENDSSQYRDAWVVKLAPNGNMLWNKLVGNIMDDQVNGVVRDSKGDIICAGYTKSQVDTLSGEAWVFKLSTNGDKLWNRSLGMTEATCVQSISKDDIVIGGYDKLSDSISKYFVMKLNKDGKKLWLREYTNLGRVDDIRYNADLNQMLISGSNWLFRLDEKGYIVWEKYFQQGDSIGCVTEADDNTIYVAGTDSTNKIWVRKIDGSGKQLWENKYEVQGSQAHINTIAAPNPQVVFVGGDISEDGLILKLSADGKLLDTFMIGNQEYDSVKTLFNFRGNLIGATTGSGEQKDFDMIVFGIK